MPVVSRCWMAALLLCAAAAHAQDLGECVRAGEGAVLQLAAPQSATPLQVAVLGQGPRAAVFSNTAHNAPCEWLPFARELVARGWQVALWKYASDGVEQVGHLAAVVDEVRRRGARKVALVGGSRGGCLSVMAGADLPRPPEAVVVLSCAAVFNRRNPTSIAPWVARLPAPVLHVTGENDTVPTLEEARADLARFPNPDKRLLVVPQSFAHGDQLLYAPAAAPVAKPAVLEFLERTVR